MSEIPAAEVQLAPASIEAIARRVAEMLQEADAPHVPDRLLAAAEVAEWWGVDRSWVYEHADELGARRLGQGRRPRLRFDAEDVAARLGRLPESPDRAATEPIRADGGGHSLSGRGRANVARRRHQLGRGRHRRPGHPGR
jgi:hypothetical protein